MKVDIQQTGIDEENEPVYSFTYKGKNYLAFKTL